MSIHCVFIIKTILCQTFSSCVAQYNFLEPSVKINTERTSYRKKENQKSTHQLASRTCHTYSTSVRFHKSIIGTGHIDIYRQFAMQDKFPSPCNIWKKSFASSHECKQMKRFFFFLLFFFICWISECSDHISQGNKRIRMVLKDMFFFYQIHKSSEIK